jgi:hypothetical protein
MGKGSSSSTKESQLSKEQARILRVRESAFKQYIEPVLRAELQETEGQGQTNKLADVSRANLDASYRDASRGLQRSLAERGVSGGFERSALAAMSSAEAKSRADNATQAYVANKEQRRGLLGLAMQTVAPQPTSAAPFHQNQKQSGGLF